MGLRQLYEKSVNEYEDYLMSSFEKIGPNLGEVLSMEGGHSLFAHSEKTDEQMKKIVTNNEKSADATFLNKTELSDYLNESLLYKLDEISDWFYEDKPIDIYNNKLARYNYNHLVLKVDFGKEIVGEGYKQDINNAGKIVVNKYSTTAVKVILTRSHDTNSQFGFYVKTFYPDITVGDAIKQIETKVVQNINEQNR